MASRLSVYFFPVLLSVCVLVAPRSIPSLPDNVAIHFNVKNEADGWVSRDQYRVFILLFLIGLPLLLVGVMAWLPRFTKVAAPSSRPRPAMGRFENGWRFVVVACCTSNRRCWRKEFRDITRTRWRRWLKRKAREERPDTNLLPPAQQNTYSKQSCNESKCG